MRLGFCRILVIVIFSIFSQDICFLFRITQVALFSVYTSLPLYNWWPHKYLSQPRLISFQPGFIALYSSACLKIVSKVSITVWLFHIWLMALKCHISARRQNKHKSKFRNRKRQMYTNYIANKGKRVNEIRLYTNCLNW